METILVIDDESSLRQTLRLALQAKGFLVLEAALCREGIQLASTKNPALIICDVDMPDGTGHDVFDALQKNPASNGIPFIFMTGKDDPRELRRSMEQGADDFLQKPFPMRTLLSAVETRLRRRAELRERLEKTEKRLQAIVEANPDLVAMADVQTRQLQYMNKAGRDLLQISPNRDVTHLTLVDIHAATEAETVEQRIIPTAVEKGIWTGEVLLRAVTNDEVPVSQVVVSHKSPDEGGAFLSVIAHDLRARKKAELERRQMEIQLRHSQKLESVGRLAAGIAHEINTPTQFIGDNLRFLQDVFIDLTGLMGEFKKLHEAARTQNFAPEITAQIDKTMAGINLPELEREIPQSTSQALAGVLRVAKIVQAMKDFSHPGTELKVPVDLNRLIDSTLTVCRNEWKYVADLETSYDPHLPTVHCHPGEFNQVILNIVVNAAHAIADKTHGREKGSIHVATSTCGSFVETRISDTGTGIPETIRGRIFEPFFTTKEVGRGTGQGLAIARSVMVDKHQGELFFETEPGVGTTFIIRLPAGDRRNGAIVA